MLQVHTAQVRKCGSDVSAHETRIKASGLETLSVCLRETSAYYTVRFIWFSVLLQHFCFVFGRRRYFARCIGSFVCDNVICLRWISRDVVLRRWEISPQFVDKLVFLMRCRYQADCFVQTWSERWALPSARGVCWSSVPQRSIDIWPLWRFTLFLDDQKL